ncbi:MAG: PAS domain S-box protein, partial [Dissulfurispiraceae bacterium]
MSHNLFIDQMDYIYFIYGLAFILLGAVTHFLSRIDKRLPWTWLCMFGFIHGFNEWLDMLAFSLGNSTIFSLLRMLLMVASFLLLVEFARNGTSALQGRNVSKWVLVPFLVLAVSGALTGIEGLTVSCRYALGLPGGIWSAWVLYRYSDKPDHLESGRWLTYAALAMAFYGFSAGFIVPPSAFFPASQINYDSFLATAGFPVQAMRCFLALVITLGLWQHYRSCHELSFQYGKDSRHRLIGRLLVIAVISVLAIGWVMTGYFGKVGFNNDLARGHSRLKYYQIHLSSLLQTVDKVAIAVSESPSLSSMTSTGGGINEKAVNSTVDRYSSLVPDTIIYIINTEGITVASSNRNTPSSFVGVSYLKRPYFSEALKGTASFYVAMGIMTKKPGYFASYPIRNRSGRITGVAVVKYTLDVATEGEENYFLIDYNGIILGASNHDLIMRELWPLSGNTRRFLRESGQYPLSGKAPLLAETPENEKHVYYAGKQARFLMMEVPDKRMSFVSIGQFRDHKLMRLLGIGGTLFIVLLNIGVFIIEEHQEADKDALRKSEYALRRVFDHVYDAVLVHDRNGDIMDINERALALYGVTRQDALKMSIIKDFLGKDNPADKVSLLWEKVLLGEPQNFECKARRPGDGTEFYVDMFFDRMELSGRHVVVATVRDITDSKRTMEELQKLSQAIRQSASAVTITDTQGRIEFVNPQAEKVTGYSASEVLGQNPMMFRSGIHPDEFYNSIFETLRSGHEWVGEICNRNKKGDLYWEHSSIAPVLNQEGNITHYILVNEDITERKQIEEALKKAKTAAEAANVAKSDFLANMSHEIRTPLNGIMGMTGLLLDTGLSEEQRNYAEMLRSSGELLLGLINDILDFSKIEAGKLEIETIEFDLRNTLEETAEFMALRAYEKG